MNFNKRLRLAEEKVEAGEKAGDSLKYQEAADNFLAAAELLKGIKGNEAVYAGCLGNAANELDKLGYYDKAKSLLEKALPLQKKFLGSEHPHVASSLNNLANIYSNQGDYEQAKQLYEKALAIREKVLDSEHPDVATSLNNLATIYSGQGDYEQAKQLYEKALAIRKKVLGSEHPDVASSLNNLANTYSDQGDYEQAKQLHKKALAIREKVLGSEHPDVATSLNNLANTYSDQGDYEQAKQLYEKALAIREKVLGSEHPNVANNLNNLAAIYSQQGNTEKATEYYQRAQSIINKVFDENHPTTKVVSENYLKLQREIEELKKRDVEQRVALEEAKKLEYLSYMATGIAHSINNPVGIIQLAAQRGLRELEKGMSVEKGQAIFQRILTQANRLHEIIQNFRDYAKGDRKNIETVELNKVVEHVKGYFENQLEAHHIKLNIEFAENPCAQANNFVLQEVLINIISNAREALENVPDASILMKTWQTAEKVGFIVEDNGAGIPETQQKSLFSPFHSTKAHGTGLGLHVTQKALTEMHGTIRYENRIPHGARFIIELPNTGESS